jgi:hypothetical protein
VRSLTETPAEFLSYRLKSGSIRFKNSLGKLDAIILLPVLNIWFYFETFFILKVVKMFGSDTKGGSAVNGTTQRVSDRRSEKDRH